MVAAASPVVDRDDAPTSPFVTPLLTDLYQISMAYAYWRAGRHDDLAVFDLFFRHNPFNGEYTVFAGLSECLRFVNSYRFSESDIAHLRRKYPMMDGAFFDYLATLDARRLRIYAIDEGTVVFPRVPLIRVEGPLLLAQLMETTFLVLVNFASLITTNAARHREVVGDRTALLEFGLRRAQGPDGGMSASRYAYMGGFNATSNVLAGKLFDIEVKGTHAHAFVSSFTSMDDLKTTTIVSPTGEPVEFAALCTAYRDRLGVSTNTSELAAFISYAQAFPNGFLALIDTYTVLDSGLYNFLAVALALHDIGYKPVGLRLDSGDLAYFSNECRKAFIDISDRFGVPFENLTIVASSDINEDVLQSLTVQGHSIDSFGIGTHLVTCQKQPALGCVYKLVEINGHPRIKVSADIGKVTIPGRKTAYRLFNEQGVPVIDLLAQAHEPAPVANCRIRCNHPVEHQKRCDVLPSRVEDLLRLAWADGKRARPEPTLRELRDRVRAQVQSLRPDHRRFLNPTPYKVSLTTSLLTFMHTLWLDETPVQVLR
ncbi:Nicotinate phosphoribosyltransferase [Plasmodiophora brassicae]